MVLVMGMGETVKVGGGALRNSIDVGDRAIDFTLNDLFGNPVTLSDYKGKVVFLNFWATWCPPCRDEMPGMESLYTALKGEDFEMLAVSTDRASKSTVSQFISNRGFTFPVLLDPSGKASIPYGISGIPTTFIIDKRGIITQKIIGARNWGDVSVMNQLRELIRK